MKKLLASLAKTMLLVVGGCSQGNEVGCLSSCESTSSIFTPLTPYTNGMAIARRGPIIMQTCGGGVAVAGGCEQPGVHLNNMEVLEQQQWNCSLLDEAEGGFSCAAYCQLGEVCFVAGGYDGRDCLSQVHIVNPSSRKISWLKPLPGPLKNGAALGIEESQSVLLFGGWDEKRTLNTVFEYSLIDQSCWLASLMPCALEGHTATQTSSQLAYIIGGYDGIGVRDTIYQFDIQARTFTQLKETLYLARENHATVVFNECGVTYLVVIGGWDGFRSLHSCEIFMLLEEAPYLERVENHRLKLDSARNKLAAIVVI